MLTGIRKCSPSLVSKEKMKNFCNRASVSNALKVQNGATKRKSAQTSRFCAVEVFRGIKSKRINRNLITERSKNKSISHTDRGEISKLNSKSQGPCNFSRTNNPHVSPQRHEKTTCDHFYTSQYPWEQAKEKMHFNSLRSSGLSFPCENQSEQYSTNWDPVLTEANLLSFIPDKALQSQLDGFVESYTMADDDCLLEDASLRNLLTEFPNEVGDSNVETVDNGETNKLTTTAANHLKRWIYGGDTFCQTDISSRCHQFAHYNRAPGFAREENQKYNGVNSVLHFSTIPVEGRSWRDELERRSHHVPDLSSSHRTRRKSKLVSKHEDKPQLFDYTHQVFQISESSEDQFSLSDVDEEADLDSAIGSSSSSGFYSESVDYTPASDEEMILLSGGVYCHRSAATSNPDIVSSVQQQHQQKQQEQQRVSRGSADHYLFPNTVVRRQRQRQRPVRYCQQSEGKLPSDDPAVRHRNRQTKVDPTIHPSNVPKYQHARQSNTIRSQEAGVQGQLREEFTNRIPQNGLPTSYEEFDNWDPRWTGDACWIDSDTISSHHLDGEIAGTGHTDYEMGLPWTSERFLSNYESFDSLPSSHQRSPRPCTPALIDPPFISDGSTIPYFHESGRSIMNSFTHSRFRRNLTSAQIFGPFIQMSKPSISKANQVEVAGPTSHVDPAVQTGSPAQRCRRRHLLQFIMELLLRRHGCVQWVNRSERIFQITNPEQLTRLWGQYKNNTQMTFDSLSRSLRLYYAPKKLERIQGRRHHYRLLHTGVIKGAHQATSRQPSSPQITLKNYVKLSTDEDLQSFKLLKPIEATH